MFPASVSPIAAAENESSVYNEEEAGSFFAFSQGNNTEYDNAVGADIPFVDRRRVEFGRVILLKEWHQQGLGIRIRKKPSCADDCSMRPYW